MDVLTLSRLQFAATISFHYIYPPLSIDRRADRARLHREHLLDFPRQCEIGQNELLSG